MSKQFLETIRCENGAAQYLTYHQLRVERSLKTLGSSRLYDLTPLITPPDNRLYRCRIIYDESALNIEYILYQKRAIQTLQAIQADHLNYRLKYADRTDLDQLFIQRDDADDILIVQNGLVTDTSIANIAFFDGERWLTPKKPLLKGTTRARLLDEKKIFEHNIKVADLDNYTAFALMNAMIGFDRIKDGIIHPLKGI